MALYSNHLTEEEKKKLAKEDLNEVNNLRGRILNYMSDLEYVFWVFVDRGLYEKHKKELKINKKFNNITLTDKKNIFVEEHKTLKSPEIDNLEKSLNKVIKSYRNPWAHGFIFYEKFEIDKTDGKKKPIKYLVNPERASIQIDNGGLRFYPIHFKEPNYIDIIRFHFPFIMGWFEKNGLLKKAEIEINLKNKKVITN